VLDRRSPIPVYHQVAVDLRQRLERGEWPVGARIASELALAEEYEVSRETVRQALAELVKDDLLETRRGSGTYVRELPRPLVYDLNGTLGAYAWQLRELGFTNRARVLEAGIVPAPEEPRGALELEPGDEVAYLVRRILINGEPAAVYRSWLDAALVPGIQDDPGLEGSLTSLLAEEYGLVAAHSESRLEVVRPTLEELALLDSDVDPPLLVIKATAYLSDGRPFEYSETSWLGDRVRLHVTSLGASPPPPRPPELTTRAAGAPPRAPARPARSPRARSTPGESG
jgi:DNA-binding GntR family transcriptional regulator